MYVCMQVYTLVLYATICILYVHIHIFVYLHMSIYILFNTFIYVCICKCIELRKLWAPERRLSYQETEGGWDLFTLVYTILCFLCLGQYTGITYQKNPKTKEYRDNAECWRANLKSVGRSEHLSTAWVQADGKRTVLNNSPNIETVYWRKSDKHGVSKNLFPV